MCWMLDVVSYMLILGVMSCVLSARHGVLGARHSELCVEC